MHAGRKKSGGMLTPPVGDLELAGVVAVRVHRLHLPSSTNPGADTPGFFESWASLMNQTWPSRRNSRSFNSL